METASPKTKLVLPKLADLPHEAETTCGHRNVGRWVIVAFEPGRVAADIFGDHAALASAQYTKCGHVDRRGVNQVHARIS